MYDILVIDDDLQTCTLLTMILEREGHRVRSATNAAEAWKLLEQQSPDIICCDLMMPVIGGLEILKKRRDLPGLAAIPILVLTGSAQPSLLEEAQRLGAYACLRKPLSIADLVSTIKAAMAARPAPKVPARLRPNPSGSLATPARM